MIMTGLAGLVLLAGCATLMALVLVHYERRRRELSIRLALGASGTRLRMQLAGELGWQALGGLVGALFVAQVALKALPALSLPGGVDLSRLALTIDWRVLTAGLLATTATLTLAAAWPVWRFTTTGLALELFCGASTPSASSQRLRQGLLSVHVSATVVVLVSAGLFIRAVESGFNGAAGFDVNRTAYLQVQVVKPFLEPGVDVAARSSRIDEQTRRLKEGLATLAGVDGVALGLPPLGPDQTSSLLSSRDIETNGERRQLRVGTLSGSADLLRTLGVPILKGRGLASADGGVTPTPAVVTASLARALWPGQDPLGQVASFGFRACRCVVVGVAADFAYGSLTQESAGVVVTINQRGFGMEPPFVVRTTHPEMLLEPIRDMVSRIAPDAPRTVIVTGREIVSRDLGRQRLGAWFLSGFGLVALLLGGSGVFGLVAYLAESRRREYGVRLALGATPRDLVRRGVMVGLLPVCIGTAAGLLVAGLISRLFTSLLPGLSSLDPATYGGVAVVMVTTATIAGATAAWRLRRVVPVEALRTD